MDVIDPRSTRRYKAIAKAVIERDGECMACHTTDNLTCDHIIPVSMGDEESWYDPENMQALCMPCNIKKSNKTVGQTQTWINPKWLAWSQR